MRRVAALLPALILVTVSALAAGATSASYRDQFDTPGYGGSNGSLNWSSTPWKEIGDDGSPASGWVQAVESGECPQGNYCLLIGSGVLNSVGASRAADLGLFQSATLSYRINFVVEGVSTGFLRVEGWDGSTWKLLRLPAYPLINVSIEESIDLPSSYLTEGFQLRFRMTGQLSGDVFVDDVQIAGQLAGTTTSTTSTSSTTSTTLPMTTTLPTLPSTTLPGVSTTSTTSSSTTTTTTIPTTSTTRDGNDTRSSTSSTTTEDRPESVTTTSTTSPATTAAGDDGAGGVPPDPPVSGIREASLGIQANFDGGRFGEIQTAGLSVMTVDIEPNYAMAVEVIESSWAYLLGLVLFIAAAIVGGLDRRRLEKAKHTTA